MKHIFILFLTLPILLSACGGEDKTNAEMGYEGDNCSDTSDCISDLLCIDFKCKRNEYNFDGDTSENENMEYDSSDGDLNNTDRSDGEPISVSGVWNDPDTGLFWQNPPIEEYLTEWESKIYCSDLELDGHTDWRLPTISELRSLIRGCPSTETAGVCNVTDECTEVECHNLDSCYSCVYGKGPVEGCYWASGLKGLCTIYTSSTAVGDSAYAFWQVRFSNGFVFSVTHNPYVRCVR